MLYNAPSADDSIRHQVEAWIAEAIRSSPSATLPLRPRLATFFLMQGRSDEAEGLFARPWPTIPIKSTRSTLLPGCSPFAK